MSGPASRRVAAFIVAAIVITGIEATSAPAAEPHWPEQLTIATASPGGTYHVYGEGLGKLLTRVLDIPVAERTTEGPSQNIQMIESDEAQIAFVTMGVAMQAWNGTGEWTGGRHYRDMRALFPMYDTPFHVVVPADSAVASVADLAGRRIGAGPRGGTAGTYAPGILAALGLEAQVSNGSYDDLAAQLQADALDALLAAAGAPFPAIAGLDAKKAVRFVPLSRDEVLKVQLAIPELAESVIPPGTYPSLLRKYRTVGMYNFAIASPRLPADLAYRIVDAVFSHHEEMMQVHPAAAATVPANFVRNTFLPYHDGALRYYSTLAAAGALGDE